MKFATKDLRTRRRMVVAGTVVAVVVAAVATTAVSSRNKVHPRRHTVHVAQRAKVAVASSVSSDIASDFPILTRTATASDQLPPTATATWMPEQRVGANASLARLASSAEGATYLIPAQTSVCVKNTTGAQNFCASATEVQAGQAQEVIVCAPPVPSTDIQVSGLLPSSATDVSFTLTNGTSVPVTLESGTYAARFARSGSLPASISWSIAGASHSAPIDVPGGASSESCQPTP
jgi:hypothetical protein